MALYYVAGGVAQIRALPSNAEAQHHEDRGGRRSPALQLRQDDDDTQVTVRPDPATTQ